MAEEKKVEKVQHANIYAALSAFQGEMKTLPKSKKVSFDTKSGGKMEYNYTPLGEIMENIYPLLGKHGLSVRHEVVAAENGLRDGIVAILTHETAKVSSQKKSVTKANSSDDHDREEYGNVVEGEIRSGIVMIPKGGEMKEVGAAITYARRYSLTMVLGLASEDDTDAELLQESAKNAIQFAYNKAKQGLEGAKDLKAVEKAMGVLKADLKALESGKAPALGLAKEQYEDLILYAEQRKAELRKNEGGK